MKRPLAYITAAWCGDPDTDMELAARYCRMAYEAGFSPICPILYLPLFINDAIPEEHKNGIDMRRDMLRRSHVLVVCGGEVDEDVKNDTRLRSDTLGDGYGEADIKAALSGSRQHPGQPRQKVSLAIDIQSKLQGKGPGYERWAKVFNLKQMAAALAYLQDNGLTDYKQLEQKATAATERFHKLSDQIKSTEAALHTNMELKAATVQYAKTRPVFEKYKASKYSKKFLAEHEADIELYRAACADFKRILDGGKLPKMDALKEEGRKLAERKKKLYAEYRKAKADMQEVTTIKANIDYLLGYSEPGRKKEQER